MPLTCMPQGPISGLLLRHISTPPRRCVRHQSAVPRRSSATAAVCRSAAIHSFGNGLMLAENYFGSSHDITEKLRASLAAAQTKQACSVAITRAPAY